MSKVDLIKDRCIGCGACMSLAPENFTFGDDGRAEMINNEITEAAVEASETCPVSAIVIENNNCECGNACNCNDECSCDDNNCECGNNCKCNK